MAVELLKLFGERVRGARVSLGVSQEAFARMVELDRAYYGRVERGVQNVTQVTADKIARALKVELAELVAKV